MSDLNGREEFYLHPTDPMRPLIKRVRRERDLTMSALVRSGLRLILAHFGYEVGVPPRSSNRGRPRMEILVGDERRTLTGRGPARTVGGEKVRSSKRLPPTTGGSGNRAARSS